MKEIVIDGVVYRSVREAAIAHKLNPRTFQGRLNKGWSLNQCLGREKKITTHPQSHAVSVEGKKFASIGELARFYNADPNLIYDRIIKLGWKPEEALGLVACNHRVPQPITVFGEQYPSLREACRKLNMSLSTVCNRLERGMTVDLAFSC